MTIIQAQNISKEFTHNKEVTQSISDFSLEIQSPQIYGLVGPNGAGKTTFIKMCLGLISSTSGALEILGNNPYKQKKEYLSQISFISGNNDTFEDKLPARELVKLQGALYGLDATYVKNKSNSLVDLFDARHIFDTPLGNLSLGEKMKFEIISKILHKPKLIFMDEPTLGLDFDAQNTLHDVILKLHKEENTTIVLTSHYLPDIQKLCSKFTVIENGRDVFSGSFDELNEESSAKGYLKTLISELEKTR